MIFGYARVSTADQELDLQRRVLHEAGAERLFEDKASGARLERPELARLVEQLREGDVVMVYKLDRLSRSLKDLLEILSRIDEAGAGFRSLTEAIDTTTAAGRMMMQMLGAFAEFERAMIVERTRAGLEAARRRGVRVGRPRALNAAQRQEALRMLLEGRSKREVARLFGVSPRTLDRLKETSTHE